MKLSQTRCPICNGQIAPKNVLTSPGIDGQKLRCYRCGIFSISGSAMTMWGQQKTSNNQIANASSWIREHQDVEIDSSNVKSLLTIPTPSVADRAYKLLTLIDREKRHLSSWVDLYVIDWRQFNPENNDLQQTIIVNQLPLLGATYSVDTDELQYLISEYLEKESGFLERRNSNPTWQVRITPKGYAFLETQKHTNSLSQIGFCAMWFDKSILPVWKDAIEPAIRDAGYEPKRIDSHPHNNRIDDEIIAMIRRSKFVVADFTGQRGGVYFEAGFALGQGLDVIWTCEETDLEKVHFDNRQYNFIKWNKDDLAQFKEKLQYRIEATLGRGRFDQQ